jgi:hypothetical protein
VVVLTPPVGLSNEALLGVIRQNWDVGALSLDYRPVGWGSHHWEVAGRNGARWFATVDRLEMLRRSDQEQVGDAFARLRAALATAVALQHSDCNFVVAPVLTSGGAPVVQSDDGQFAVSLFPYMDGESSDSGAFATPAHRRGVLDLVVALHGVPRSVAPGAIEDDFTIPHRDVLERTLGPLATSTSTSSGPYAARAAELVRTNARTIQRQLDLYDGLVDEHTAAPSTMVLTHGEPHAGNTVLTSDGFMLIDWDTVLVAPPERDLWSLDPGDHSILDEYRRATGWVARWPMLYLYGVRWDLADIAAYVNGFVREHSGDANDEKSWDELQSMVAALRSE